jgi:isoquinoline 1-oxidoreductase beta subunit
MPKDPPLKDPKQWRYIGKSMPRLDALAKSTGRAEFGLDVRLPNLHFAVVARPPSFGGRVGKLDASAAKAVPGVVAVKEIPSGVAVIAKHTWAAMQGRRALRVEWQDGKGAGFSSTRLSTDYAALARKPGVLVASRGSVSDVRAGRHLEADYSTPYLAHAPMEPLNCVVAFGPAGCDIHTGTQFQTADHHAAAEVAGLPADQIRIHTPYLGGGFGRRANPANDFVREAVAIAKGFNAPVMTVWSREDDIRGGYYRPLAHNRLTATLDPDGSPVAWTHTQIVQALTKGTSLEKLSVDPKTGIERAQHEGASDLPYDIENFEMRAHDGVAPVPVLWWRSVGHSNTAFAVESFLDECAHMAGADPLDYRLRLLKKQPRHTAALKLVAEKAHWGHPMPSGHARGLAVHASFNSVVAQIAEVSLVDGKPRVHRVTAAIHCGTAVNPGLIAAQVEGAICFGLSAALYGEVGIEDGRVTPSNFNDYPPVRLQEMPSVEVYIVPSTDYPTGVGEPGLPPIAPAVANALFALTGVRARRLPLTHTDFTPTGRV